VSSRGQSNAAVAIDDTAEEYFHQYLELPVESRAEFLALVKERDPALAEELESLILAQEKLAENFLEPALGELAKSTALDVEFSSESQLQPKTIGKYKILSSLGKGGTAEVFLAKASGPGGFEKQVAIKCVLPHLNDNDELRSQFESEARLTSQLYHPNIAQIYDLIAVDDMLLLVMEYIRGKNLRALLKNARASGVLLPFPISVYIINEVCKGLIYAHEKKDDTSGVPLGIIHRDISPKNIMLGFDGLVKIIDFGIAKVTNQSHQTVVGVLKGTPRYMSPEQAAGIPLDQRSDLFSLTVLLWECISGKPLFSEENTLTVLKKVREHDSDIFDFSALDVPSALTNILKKGLEPDPDNRFQSARELHEALEAFLKENGSSVSQQAVAEWISHTQNDTASNSTDDNSTHVTLPPKTIKRRHWITWGLVAFVLSYFAFRYLPKRNEPAKIAEPEQVVAPLPQDSPTAVPQCSVRISSEPKSARVVIDGKFHGKTPVRLDWNCNESAEVTLDHPGYRRLKKIVHVGKPDTKLKLRLTKKKTPPKSRNR
jgi:serine/threonine protein kinase